MIEIEAAEDYRLCQCCYCNGNVKEIAFRSERQGVVVALCSDCISELLRKLDAVEVVRCKDCKRGKIICDDCAVCEYRQTIMPSNGFCSYGKRKDVIQK